MGALVGESDRGTTNEPDPYGAAPVENKQNHGTPGEWQPLPEEQASDPGNVEPAPGMHPSHRGTIRRKKEKVRPVPVFEPDNLLDDDGNLIEEAEDAQ